MIPPGKSSADAHAHIVVNNIYIYIKSAFKLF